LSVNLAVAVALGESVDDICGAGDEAAVIGKFSGAWSVGEGGANAGEAGGEGGDEGEVRVVEDLEGGLASEIWVP